MKRSRPLGPGKRSLERGSTFSRAGRRYVVIECLDCGILIERRSDRPDVEGPCTTCANKRRRNRAAVTCEHCGEGFEAKVSQLVQGKGRYCSTACRYADMPAPSKSAAARKKISQAKRGSRNAMWRGTDTPGSIARVFSIRLKGETACRNCGRADMHLHLHHIVPRSMCKAGRRDLRNGVPLCAACHTRWHHRTITIHREILTAEEWEFVSSLELLGQNITAWLDDRYPPRSAEMAA